MQGPKSTRHGLRWGLTVSLVKHFAVEVADLCLCTDRSVVIPADQAEKSGLLPDQVKISEKYGGGFPANVEGLHQLHCLVTTNHSDSAMAALTPSLCSESSSQVTLL